MCIRDSLYHAQISVAALRDIDGTLLGFTVAQRDITRLKDCLLYTSDAADERSSVDLGGRRIIKKKKRVPTD